MADWLAPFHAPKFTTEEFNKQKAKYNEKNGYTVSLPAAEDIIQLGLKKPMTEKEKDLWTGTGSAANLTLNDFTPDEIRQLVPYGEREPVVMHKMSKDDLKLYKKVLRNRIPKERRDELQAEKDAKRKKFVKMLQSPSPGIVRSAGAILTSLDDAQDAISTLAAIGMLAGKLLPGVALKALVGPLGWLLTAAEILRLINPYSRVKGPKGGTVTGRGTKRKLEKITDNNPFGKKAKLKLAKQIRKFKPGLSHLIEAAQVTDGIFGIGISIGPLMGLAQDIVAGAVRTIKGDKVKWFSEPTPLPDYAQIAQRALRSAPILFGVPWEKDTDNQITALLSINLAMQAMEPFLKEENPLNHTEALASCEISAPRPTDPLTIEVIEEAGYTLDEVCNWPQNGKQWISLDELQEKTAPIATENLRRFARENGDSTLAYTALMNAHDFALTSIMNIEGVDSIKVEYSQTERIVIMILDNGWCYPDDITDAQVQKFEDWCAVEEYMNIHPSAKEVWRYAEQFCGFTWAKSIDEDR